MTCAQSAGTGTKLVEEEDRKDQNGPGAWHRGKGADEWTSGRRDDGSEKGGKRSGKGSKPDWYSDKDKRGTGNKGKGQGQGRGSILL